MQDLRWNLLWYGIMINSRHILFMDIIGKPQKSSPTKSYFFLMLSLSLLIAWPLAEELFLRLPFVGQYYTYNSTPPPYPGCSTCSLIKLSGCKHYSRYMIVRISDRLDIRAGKCTFLDNIHGTYI